ncbi:MAG: DUF3343 domain-containing protein [Candidatus Eisenbacteria bacterium]|nr:DUF3343 domain-containing protein [Candidatus Eisenbacteria bacterium]
MTARATDQGGSAAAHCVILFASIHDVTAADRELRDAQIWCDMIPTPRSLSSDCGMSLEFRCRDLSAVRRRLQDARARPRGFFRRAGEQYVPLPAREGEGSRPATEGESGPS